ncbi:DUF805 domain-containing protein [Rhodobacter sp. KR11]|jgi:uncharacterized membrane protein YhaH (DUF805 family)|uniref:DUF805 domain-containing protein n=1 Tax=Rhodobacter sp. KR11 TaxID=2974588 RepID=UPI0022223F21|nr:DUF805 domain-containing protein [Rhodobacter sp. KR11]MCW1918293.1 DUF805 domain-containing protein [Rhodobacter sp. KR11]
MTFAQSVKTCLSNYATFSGRASRSEYWWFQLFFFGVIFLPSFIGGWFLGMAGPTAGGATEFDILTSSPLALGAFVLAGLIFLALLMPIWAVAVRRFHDRDLSGWVFLALVLVGFIPAVGWLASIGSFVITVLRGTPGPNRFGVDPLNPSSADVFT